MKFPHCEKCSTQVSGDVFQMLSLLCLNNSGGLELALMCDLRVMEETAKVGFLNRRFGVPLIDGGSVRLPELIGLSRANDLIITGRIVEAK